jgi:hypothetical protein
MGGIGQIIYKWAQSGLTFGIESATISSKELHIMLIDPKVRFESQVTKVTDSNGYSGVHWIKRSRKFCLGGENIPARLAAWILWRGPLKANQKLHRIFFCHVGECVNPEHHELRFKLEVEPWAGPDGRWHSPGPGRPRGSKKSTESSPAIIEDLPPLLPEEADESSRHARIAERARLVAARRRGEGS